ncbi:hypothetical protein EI94DRAFT_1799504 [Lactarius quietus]|nr:hypothetical protein EI94DRAFT_1799504 [Lactarius quietus]
MDSDHESSEFGDSDLDIPDIPEMEDGIDMEALLESTNIPPALDLPVEQLHKLLRALQVNHRLLAEKYKSLRIEYGTLAASYKSRKSNGPRAERGALSGQAKEISLAGGRFSVVGELWVGSSLLDIPYPRDVDPLSVARYANKASEDRSVIAELYWGLLPDLQKALSNGNRRAAFKTTFLKQLNQEHVNSVHTVHLYAPQILGLNPKFFKKDFDRTNIPEIRALFFSPQQPDELYPMWPAMLFPPTDVNQVHVFRCSTLMTVHIVLLYEP